MSTARTSTPVVAPPRRTRVLQLLPAAALFASLVLGGPTLSADLSTRLMVPDNGPQCPNPTPQGDCINTGDNTGND